MLSLKWIEKKINMKFKSSLLTIKKLAIATLFFLILAYFQALFSVVHDKNLTKFNGPGAELASFIPPTKNTKMNEPKAQSNNTKLLVHALTLNPNTIPEILSMELFKMEPVCQCHSNPESSAISRSRISNPTKLIFVHVFKTAGSTLRAFFRDYSTKCHKGWATIISCSGAEMESFRNNSDWGILSKGGHSCVLKDGVTRNGKDLFGRKKKKRKKKILERHRVNNSFLETHVDMFGGHLPLGCGDLLANPNQPEEKANVRYMTFVRDAVTKYLSGRMFVNKGHSKSWYIENLTKDINRDFERKEYHFRYENYLITPAQRESYRRNHITLSLEDKTELIIHNLIEYNVIIGVVERMSDSMELLKHYIDPINKMESLFVKYGMKDPVTGEIVRPREKNTSPVSTSAVLAEIKNDKKLYEKLVEIVKYEQRITDFAVGLHSRQYNMIEKMGAT